MLCSWQLWSLREGNLILKLCKICLRKLEGCQCQVLSLASFVSLFCFMYTLILLSSALGALTYLELGKDCHLGHYVHN